jgi:hypothetical protein
MAFTTGMMHARASPLSDLGSPSQEVRTRAAALIRDNHLYKATSRAPWDELVSMFKVEETASDICASLQKKGIGQGLTSDDILPQGVIILPLDDSWRLSLTMDDSRLVEYKIVEEPKEIRVEPPAGYSGFWRTYRINGKLAGLYDYQNGRNLGNTLRMSP